jgi:AsmA protein
LPYLEATNSRINIMRGTEKLPFSLVDTDLSFWQENPGDWRVRLKGEPSRTDQSLELSGSGDTGVVRLEASLRSAPELRQMPLHVDLEWSDAQVGQLTRLALGSDAGWRGNLTGEVNLDGTLDAAQIKTRLRADNVHRAEFAPADPLDFDARCSLLYHFSWQTVDKLVCDSALGDGHVRLAGDLPREGRGPHLTLELDKISAGAALDAMRTVRNGIGRDLEARGTIAGKLVYNPDTARVASDQAATPKAGRRTSKIIAAKPRAVLGPLTGSLVVEGLQLSGDGLSTPVQAPKFVFEPAAPATDQHAAMVASVAVPLGGASPLEFAVRIGLAGYQVTLRGPASVARVRELAKVSGVSQGSLFDSLAGEPISVDSGWRDTSAEFGRAGGCSASEHVAFGWADRVARSPAGGCARRQTYGNNHAAQRQLEGRLPGECRDDFAGHFAYRWQQQPMGSGCVQLWAGKGNGYSDVGRWLH